MDVSHFLVNISLQQTFIDAIDIRLLIYSRHVHMTAKQKQLSYVINCVNCLSYQFILFVVDLILVWKHHKYDLGELFHNCDMNMFLKHGFSNVTKSLDQQTFKYQRITVRYKNIQNWTVLCTQSPNIHVLGVHIASPWFISL